MLMLTLLVDGIKLMQEMQNLFYQEQDMVVQTSSVSDPSEKLEPTLNKNPGSATLAQIYLTKLSPY